MTNTEHRLFRSAVCSLAVAACMVWFAIMNVMTQKDHEGMTGYTIEFGWPLQCFEGEIDVETAENAGFFQVVLSTRELSVRWSYLLANLTLVTVLCGCIALAASRVLSAFPRVHLHHYFGLLAFVAWCAWWEKPFFDRADPLSLQVEVTLRKFAFRSTWLFVLMGCLFFVPLLHLLRQSLSNLRHRLGLGHSDGQERSSQ